MTYIEFLDVYGGRLIDGTIVTIYQFFLATLVAVVVALAFGLMRLSQSPVLRAIAVAYIEFFRGTSLLVQLFWIFFVLPLFGITLDKFTAGFLAVGLNMGAYGGRACPRRGSRRTEGPVGGRSRAQHGAS